MRVAGVDGTKGGWVAVTLDDGRIRSIQRVEGVETRFADLDVNVIAIDVPIGFGPRQADSQARATVGGSTVFAIPAAEAFDGERYGPGLGISAQAFALGPRIRWASRLAETDRRLYEVHPEVCFWAMNGGRRLAHRKKSAGGILERVSLLEGHGLGIDFAMLGDAASAPFDDVLDAAACAWTAERIEGGRAVSLPDPPQEVGRLRMAIWY